jgi:endonuclease/exonuclease/phosphatase family metal-dependent hydrolase
MRIVSLNTWKCDGVYARRLPQMIEGIGRLQPDIVLLQEVFATDDGRYDTAGSMAEALSLDCVRAPSRYKTRQVDGRPFPSSCGQAVLTRLPVLERHIVDLPMLLEDGERIAQLVKLSFHGQIFWVGNLHLTHLGGAFSLRRHQLTSFLNAVQRFAKDEPIVISGDFNASIDSPDLAPLRDARFGLVNCFHGLAKYTHCTADGQLTDIDHLLVGRRGAWEVAAASTAMHIGTEDLSENASDHAALVVDLNLIDLVD